MASDINLTFTINYIFIHFFNFINQWHPTQSKSCRCQHRFHFSPHVVMLHSIQWRDAIKWTFKLQLRRSNSWRIVLILSIWRNARHLKITKEIWSMIWVKKRFRVLGENCRMPRKLGTGGLERCIISDSRNIPSWGMVRSSPISTIPLISEKWTKHSHSSSSLWPQMQSPSSLRIVWKC